MPYNVLHKKQKNKNYIMLIVLITIAMVFFAVATIKMDNFLTQQPKINNDKIS